VSRTVLVLGGAGFVGSHVAARFVRGGDRVIVLDGLLPRTGGRVDNLREILGEIELVQATVEAAADLSALCARSDVIVDAVAWTSHHLALREPLHDLALNAAAHLHVLRAVPPRAGKAIVYLGSRGQYGRVQAAAITEETPMVPEDVQGIHKLAGESYYRVFARVSGLRVASLRFPNCFGPRQPRGEGDIGLLGGFLRDLSAGRTVEVYGARRRQIVYAPDVAEVVFQLAADVPEGFTAFNYAGRGYLIEELVRALAALVGRGGYVVRDLPEEIARIDVGDAELRDDRLRARLGALPDTDLQSALRATVDSFRGEQA
jgi:UDP-glucose 4-epimerase